MHFMLKNVHLMFRHIIHLNISCVANNPIRTCTNGENDDSAILSICYIVIVI